MENSAKGILSRYKTLQQIACSKVKGVRGCVCWKGIVTKSYIIKFSLSVCMSVRNRLPNNAYYGDEAFTSDSMGPG